MRKEKIKAVLFDMDGVLVDTEQVSIRVYQNILKEYGREMSVEHYGKYYSGRSEAENVQRLITEYDLPLDPIAFIPESIRLEAIELDKGVPLKEGVREVLDWLDQNGFQKALATSSESVRADKLLAQHDLKKEFCALTDSSDFTHGKPDPEVFITTLEKLKLQPEECLVIEDSENGVLAAAVAGIPVIMIPDMKQPSDFIRAKTAAVLDSLHDFPAWLSQTEDTWDAVRDCVEG